MPSQYGAARSCGGRRWSPFGSLFARVFLLLAFRKEQATQGSPKRRRNFVSAPKRRQRASKNSRACRRRSSETWGRHTEHVTLLGSSRRAPSYVSGPKQPRGAGRNSPACRRPSNKNGGPTRRNSRSSGQVQTELRERTETASRSEQEVGRLQEALEQARQANRGEAHVAEPGPVRAP